MNGLVNHPSTTAVIHQLSPHVRRLLAIAIMILCFFVIWTIVLSPIAAQMNASLTKLQDARFQRIRLENIQSRAEPDKSTPIPIETLVIAKTVDEAAAQVNAHLMGLATQNGLQVANVTMRPVITGSKLITFDFALTGEEVNVSRFINSLERGNPTLRLRSWQIDSPEIAGSIDETSDTTSLKPVIQFSGQAAAAWIKP